MVLDLLLNLLAVCMFFGTANQRKGDRLMAGVVGSTVTTGALTLLYVLFDFAGRRRRFADAEALARRNAATSAADEDVDGVAQGVAIQLMAMTPQTRRVVLLALREHGRRQGGSDADFAQRWLPPAIADLIRGKTTAAMATARAMRLSRTLVRHAMGRARVGPAGRRSWAMPRSSLRRPANDLGAAGTADGGGYHLTHLSDAAAALQGCGSSGGGGGADDGEARREQAAAMLHELEKFHFSRADWTAWEAAVLEATQGGGGPAGAELGARASVEGSLSGTKRRRSLGWLGRKCSSRGAPSATQLRCREWAVGWRPEAAATQAVWSRRLRRGYKSGSGF